MMHNLKQTRSRIDHIASTLEVVNETETSHRAKFSVSSKMLVALLEFNDSHMPKCKKSKSTLFVASILAILQFVNDLLHRDISHIYKATVFRDTKANVYFSMFT